MKTAKASFSRGIFFFALILLLDTGCTARTYTITRTSFLLPPPRAVAVPAGTFASIRVQGTARERLVEGELIEVRQDGLLILTAYPPTLTLLPYDLMLKLRFDTNVGINRNVRGARVFGQRAYQMPPLREDQVRQRALARFSRYPFGVDEARLQRLLNVLGQSELVVFGSE